MIEAAKKLTKPNLQFKLKDINTLNYDEAFDLVFSNATLHWIRNHDQLLEQTFRCLRKKGSARLNFAADGNCSHFFKVVKEGMLQPQFAQYFKSFTWPWYMPTIAEYEHLASQSQFIEVKVWGEIADRYFPNKDAMIKWVDQPSIVPFLEHIPVEAKSSFRDYVVERMIGETLQVDGRCFETFRRINLLGKK